MTKHYGRGDRFPRQPLDSVGGVMGSKRHKRTRDVPHPSATHGDGRERSLTGNWTPHPTRVRKECGGSFENKAVKDSRAPARPAFCMLFEDLMQGEPPPGVF